MITGDKQSIKLWNCQQDRFNVVVDDDVVVMNAYVDDSRVSAQWDNAVHPSWPQPGKLLHLGHAARAHISYIKYNPRYKQLAEASCCDMGWIIAQHGRRCSWSVAKKTGSMYPCTRWSLWTLDVTLLARHSSCHISRLALFRATNAKPRPALSRATNVLRNATLPLVRWKSFPFYKVVW